tara:strand:- start:1196 stop:2914 length:1719 start_codon:yes stop_codon:yes gene_type:complete
MNHSWNLKNPESKIVDLLSDQLRISKILSILLVNREVNDLKDADIFLNPTLDKLPNPFLLKDMDKTINRLIDSIESGEKIVIYGDFDCDGVTSTTILFSFLRSIEANVEFYIPERIEEGYGINLKSIKNLADSGARLIVSTDCGISENELVESCKELDLDFLITDHHTVPDIKPDSFSIVNPKQKDCGYPFKEICAAGVAFNLIMALRRKLREKGYFEFVQEPNLARYLDLVAIGTIADSMPILGVNRIFVQNGLLEIPKTHRLGLHALLKKDKSSYTARDVSFEIAPKINATGRVGKASNAVKLLIEDDESKIDSLLTIIDEDNKKRRFIQDQVTSEALVQAETYLREDPKINSLVLSSTNWHPGVIGIVASKMVDKFHRPCAVITLTDKIGKGSLRTNNGINLFEVLKKCEASLTQFGGHAGAAGITIKPNDIENFRNLFKTSIDDYDYDISESIDIDAEISFSDIDQDLIDDIHRIEPFGKENESPLFLTNNVQIKTIKILKEKHLEMMLRGGNDHKRAIWFNCDANILNKQKERTLADKNVNIVYSIQKDTYNGNTNITLIIRDLTEA